MKFEGQLKSYLVPIIDNAINCGNSLKSNSTIYFVSDNHDVVTDTITRDIPTDVGISIRPVSRPQHKEPLHYGAATQFNDHGNHSIFFPIFEDLLIMGGSSCVADLHTWL